MAAGFVGTTYAAASERLGARDSRKVGANTYLQRRDTGQEIALKLHKTDVVTFQPDGGIRLDSGGWTTSTTKDRMSWVIPISQDKGRWFVMRDIPYADGMVVYPDGSTQGEGQDTRKADRALKRRVSAYAKDFADALPVGEPGSGDCWFCYFDWQRVNPAHLDSHMEEAYFVPSLAYRALQMFGGSMVAYWTAFDTSFDSGVMNGPYGIGRKQVRRAIYRYVLRQMGLAA
jgi:hypothetical protein